MIDVCTSWEMDDLALLDDEMMQKLLDDGWENNRVPKLEEVGGKRVQASAATFGVSTSAILSPTIGFLAGATCMALILLAPRR